MLTTRPLLRPSSLRNWKNFRPSSPTVPRLLIATQIFGYPAFFSNSFFSYLAFFSFSAVLTMSFGSAPLAETASSSFIVRSMEQRPIYPLYSYIMMPGKCFARSNTYPADSNVNVTSAACVLSLPLSFQRSSFSSTLTDTPGMPCTASAIIYFM